MIGRRGGRGLRMWLASMIMIHDDDIDGNNDDDHDDDDDHDQHGEEGAEG